MPRIFYYLTSFLVGGVLMACELCVARLISPFYGASLYVWAATIGTTLVGLASGYYYAGQLASKPNLDKILVRITAITTVYIVALPMFSSMIMQAFMPLHVLSGIVLSTLVFNIPLFFLFGLFSPIIIQLLNRDTQQAGKDAGIIYGLSTLSGVLFLVVIGVYALPTIGTTPSVYAMGALLLVLSGVQFVMVRKVG